MPTIEGQAETRFEQLEKAIRKVTRDKCVNLTAEQWESLKIRFKISDQEVAEWNALAQSRAAIAAGDNSKRDLRNALMAILPQYEYGPDDADGNPTTAVRPQPQEA